MCNRLKNYYAVNIDTAQAHELHCKAYHCQECGPKKAYKLQQALQKYLENWSQIRFWTFTLAKSDQEDVLTHYKKLSECWRRFCTYIRRNKGLKERQRNFKYIKVVEQHKSGALHLHVFVSDYLPYEVVQNIWEELCKWATGHDVHSGQAWVKILPNAKVGAKYITKYVTKLTCDLYENIRRYSKSKCIVLFFNAQKTGNFILMKYSNCTEKYIDELNEYLSTLLVLHKHNFTSEDAIFALDMHDIMNE